MRADRTIGIPDRDRGLEDGLKGLANIQALGLPANKDRYRLERARHLARRLGGNGLGTLCLDYGLLSSRHGIELRLQLGFGRGQLRLDLVCPRGCTRLGVLGLRFCLSGTCGNDRTIDGGQLRLGSEHQIFNSAHRRRRSSGFSGGCHGSEPRLIGLSGRLVRFGCPGGCDSADGRLQREQNRMGDLDGRHIAWRYYHAHAQLGCVEQAFGKVVGHPDAAVRRRIPRQRTTMESDARPSDALHVRHIGIVI
jgi:hypothetical protein